MTGVGVADIEKRILMVREQLVMLDADLADLYEVPTRALNQAVKRNRNRFPGDFMFRVTEDEWEQLVEKGGEVRQQGGRRYRPYAFTERGAGMLASVLRSRRAARVTVEILRTFRQLRPDDAPHPDVVEARKVHGLFAVIRDGVFLQRDDTDFTTGEAYTYFIQVGEDEPIKIGWTKNLLVRLRTFRTMFPMPLRLLGVIPGDMEDWCHGRFATFRVGGEWFAPDPVLLEFIRERAKTPPESCQWFGKKRPAE